MPSTWPMMAGRLANRKRKGPLKPGQDEDFHDLIAERYERTATVITSNLDFTEWGEAFPNKLLGASTLDRIRHAAYRLVHDGKSYCTPRGEAEAENQWLQRHLKPRNNHPV